MDDIDKHLSKLKDYEKVVIWITMEMDVLVENERNIVDLETYIGNCKTQLLCVAKKLHDFVEDTKSVCYKGSISCTRSGLIRISAWWSYGKALVEHIDRVMEQFKKFVSACDTLADSCQSVIKVASEKNTHGNIIMVLSTAFNLGLTAGCVVLPPTTFLTAAAVTIGGIVFGAQAVGSTWQTKKYKGIKETFEDIHEVVMKFRMVATVLKEDLTSLKEYVHQLQHNDVSYTLQRIYGKLEDIQSYADNTLPELQRWSRAKAKLEL